LIASHSAEDGFAFDVEHLAIARRAGYAMQEVGIPWTHQDGGTVRPFRDGLRMLRAVWRIRRRMRTLHLEGRREDAPEVVVVATSAETTAR
ncbi:MAG: hypothetical protein KDA28_13460, partial [Phycisphaerales bacterium]|nr:hypothetical protein [Phycisphaerales bacterium]